MKTLAFCGDYDKTELLVKGIELSVILQAVFQENVWGKKCWNLDPPQSITTVKNQIDQWMLTNYAY